MAMNVTMQPSNVTEPQYFTNIPAAVCMAIFAVIGTVGNSVVLYVFITKFKQKTFNIFIVFLAVSDVISSGVLMPLDVVDLLLPTRFWGCKPLVVIATCTAMATGFVLVAIAVLRYKGICQPLKPNISVFQAKVICGVSVGIAVALSWPSAVLVGKIPDELGPGLYVMNCATEEKFKDSVYPLVFYGFLFLMFVAVFLTLIVLYAMIGARLRQREKYGPSAKPRPSTSQFYYSCQETSISESQLNCRELNPSERKVNYGTNINNSEIQEESVIKDISNSNEPSTASNKTDQPTQPSVDGEPNSSSSSASNQSASNIVPAKKITHFPSKNTFKMLFVVTLVFLLSYLPHLSLMLYEAVGSDLDTSPLGESFVGIFIRSYLISNVANPFIYGCCSYRFREETATIFKKIKIRLHIL